MRIPTAFGLEVRDAPLVTPIVGKEFLSRFREADCMSHIVMGYSSDYMPFIGSVPGKPGQLIAAGFSGHGMPLILLSTKGIAQMILHGKTFEEVGVPKIFKVTQERLDSRRNDILSSIEPVKAGTSVTSAKL